MGRLDGKTAVICGAGQTPGQTIGNGRAMAVLFAREGARVLCVDRVAERAQETVDMITAEGGQAFALAANIAKADGADAVVAAAGDTLGRLDILVNNVGVGGGDGPAHKVDEDAFDRILAINLKGAWLTSKAAIPVMREQGGGAIVNTASELGETATANIPAYCSSKGAVVQLTRAMALEHAREGIRINAICPGPVMTDLLAGRNDEAYP